MRAAGSQGRRPEARADPEPRTSRRPLKERQCVLCEADGVGFVGGGDVDHAIAHLDLKRPHLVGFHNPSSPPSIIAGPPMPMLASGVAMIEIRAAEQRRVARETATRGDTDARDDAGEPGPERERHHVEPGDHRVIGIARPSAAALGEEHDGQAPSLDDLEETVLLAMAHHALRAREDRVVVREHRALRMLFATNSLLTRAVPATRPSAGVRRIRSSTLRRPRCAAIARPPYSTKLPSSHRSARFSRAVRRPAGVTCVHHLGASLVADQRTAAQRPRDRDADFRHRPSRELRGRR